MFVRFPIINRLFYF